MRWATDRIGDTGVVAFVTGGGWVTSNSGDGIRLSLASEYSRIYVYNLRGDQRGDWKREGGKVFGEGSQNSIAILIGVKDPAYTGPCEIYYRDIGDYLSREEKLHIVAAGALDAVEWETITPNAEGDWTNQRNEEFQAWPTMGNKRAKSAEAAVFKTYSHGLSTNRDPWVYNYSRKRLDSNVQRLIGNYNSQLEGFSEYCRRLGVTRPTEATVNEYLSGQPEATDPSRIKWSRGLRRHLSRNAAVVHRPASSVIGTYRPFCLQHVYFDSFLNEERSQLASFFPTPHHANLGIVLTGPSSHFEFTPFVTDQLPNLHALDTAQYFPRWTYEKPESSDSELDFAPADAADLDSWGYRRIDNITDDTLGLYSSAIGDQVDKDNIFYYVYGLLHDSAYRSTYASDLKKALPHIPTPDTRERFEQLAAAGRRLSDLHVNYQTAVPYPLDLQLKPGTPLDDRETWRVSRMKWGKKKDPETGKNVDDRTTIIYSPKITITGIPEVAERYMLGPRSALAWLIDRYQVRTDKASGIVNDPNDWCDEHDDFTYVVDLIKRVTTVAVETMKIVDSLR
ncbi:Type ISP restriction-modification enzyme LLaBIII C-terminal specificity domain-containing protein [Williamsia muralis]|uniref:type ISP restriction/modification enzyme n=1 Tax=Williamsia marianensis TaxID=85044 RepID=UPI0039E840B9